MSERVRCEGRPAWVKALRPSYSGGVGQRAVQRSTKEGPERKERTATHASLRYGRLTWAPSPPAVSTVAD